MSNQLIIFIAGIAYTILSGVIVYLFSRASDHEKRVQRLEDVLPANFKSLEKKVDNLSIKVDNLAEQVHKEKNVENQLQTTIIAILKHLEKSDIKSEQN